MAGDSPFLLVWVKFPCSMSYLVIASLVLAIPTGSGYHAAIRLLIAGRLEVLLDS